MDNLSIVESALKQRYKNGIFCPYCESKNIKKHGKYKNRHRYICKDCFKSFNELTGTIFSGTHNINKWNDFLISIQNIVSLRKEASTIGLSTSTIFYWRHKLIRSLSQDNDENYHGITEVFHIPYPKTDKSPTHPSSYQSEHHLRSSSCSRPFACFDHSEYDRFWLILTYERRGKIMANILDKSCRDNEFAEFFKSKITKKNTFCLWNCAPASLALKTLSKKNKDISVYIRNLGNSPYNPKYVFKFFKSYIEWQNNFFGISTKYIVDYISWYKNLSYVKFSKSVNSISKILKESLKRNLILTNFSACL
ncbi:MAG: hypothetical protein ACERKV_11980 [Clostridiaceae bacterium]